MTAPVTFDLDEETLSALDAYAARIDRPRNLLVNQALDEWLTLQAAQVAEIEAGLAEADRGEFVPDEEIARILHKYDAKR